MANHATLILQGFPVIKKCINLSLNILNRACFKIEAQKVRVRTSILDIAPVPAPSVWVSTGI